jgi:hypothetical protein
MSREVNHIRNTRHAEQTAGSVAHCLPAVRTAPCAARRGTTILELLVSFSLLITVLSLSATLVVRHGRILTSSRQYRLALDELSNQAERLAALPPQEVAAEVEHLKPSEFTAARLAAANLEGQLEPADVGQRLRLKIYWNEPQRRETPVTLVAWLPPEASSNSAAPAEGSQP